MLERFRKRAVYLLRKMNPPQIIVLMFLAVILTGASILTLPASSAAGTPTDFPDSCMETEAAGVRGSTE